MMYHQDCFSGLYVASKLHFDKLRPLNNCSVQETQTPGLSWAHQFTKVDFRTVHFQCRSLHYRISMNPLFEAIKRFEKMGIFDNNDRNKFENHLCRLQLPRAVASGRQGRTAILRPPMLLPKLCETPTLG